MIIESKEQKIPFEKVSTNEVFKSGDFFYLKTDPIEGYDNISNCWNLNEKCFDYFENYDMVILRSEAKLIV